MMEKCTCTKNSTFESIMIKYKMVCAIKNVINVMMKLQTKNNNTYTNKILQTFDMNCTSV